MNKLQDETLMSFGIQPATGYAVLLWTVMIVLIESGFEVPHQLQGGSSLCLCMFNSLDQKGGVADLV